MLNYEQVQKITQEFHSVGTAEEQDAFIEKNYGAIAGANKVARKLLRVGMPLSTRMDSRTDEIPFIAGLKNFVKYVGSSVGVGIAARWAWKLIF